MVVEDIQIKKLTDCFDLKCLSSYGVFFSELRAFTSIILTVETFEFLDLFSRTIRIAIATIQELIDEPNLQVII